MAKKKQIEALKNQIRNPEIRLNEKVMDNIKGLTIDDEINVTATLKVLEIGRERAYDVPMEESGKEMPKVLNARFEVKDIKKIKK